MVSNTDALHHDFLQARGYRKLHQNSGRIYVKGGVWVQMSKDLKKCIIFRKNKKLDSHNMTYHVVYKGGYIFDVPEFAEVLFRKLKLDFIPKKLLNFDPQDFEEAMTDGETLLDF